MPPPAMLPVSSLHMIRFTATYASAVLRLGTVSEHR